MALFQLHQSIKMKRCRSICVNSGFFSKKIFLHVNGTYRLKNNVQGRSRQCGHAVMTAPSFGQFRPKEQEILFFLKECGNDRTKFWAI